MSVFQVEEYYIHIDTTDFSKESIEKARVHLIAACCDFEVGSNYIVVDGFDCEAQAEDVETVIIQLINRQ